MKDCYYAVHTMTGHNDVGVIIPWCNRPELSETLVRNRSALLEHVEAVTIVNCGGDPDHAERIAADANLPILSLVHVHASHFNKCLALNIGAWVIGTTYLLLLDADIVLSKACLPQMVRASSSGRCVYVRRVYESEGRVVEARGDRHGMTSFAYAIHVRAAERTGQSRVE